MISNPLKYKLYDGFQKSWVTLCMGFTGFGIATVIWQVQHYVRTIKPQQLRDEEKLKEELLKEGRMISQQLQAASYS